VTGAVTLFYCVAGTVLLFYCVAGTVPPAVWQVLFLMLCGMYYSLCCGTDTNHPVVWAGTVLLSFCVVSIVLLSWLVLFSSPTVCLVLFSSPTVWQVLFSSPTVWLFLFSSHTVWLVLFSCPAMWQVLQYSSCSVAGTVPPTVWKVLFLLLYGTYCSSYCVADIVPPLSGIVLLSYCVVGTVPPAVWHCSLRAC
jgi:hypothetical protein